MRKRLHYPAYDYLIFGLRVQTDQSLPNLQKNSKKISVPHVQVLLDNMPVWVEKELDHSKELFYESGYLDYKGESALKIWKLRKGSYFWLCYNDGTEFLVNRAGTKIWSIRSDDTTLEDTMIYLVGPVLGFVLRLRGITCLHASAIAVGGQAVAFLGSAEAGKSTIAAIFALKGYPVITEDIVTLCSQDHTFLVQPGYPFISLWPDSVKLLYGNSISLPRLTPATGVNAKWDKRYLDLTTGKYRVPQKPIPLGAIYILEGVSQKHESPPIEKVSHLEGFTKIISNTYVRCSLDRALQVQEFKLLAQLANAIPIRKVHSFLGSNGLIKLHKEIVKDLGKNSPSIF